LHRRIEDTGTQLVPTTLTQLILFLSSYAPFFLILGFKGTLDIHVPRFVLYGVSSVSVVGLFAYIAFIQRLSPDTVVPARVSPKDGDVMSYIVTYIVPFIDMKLDGPGDIAAVVLLFGTLAVLYVNSNMLYVNPVLNVVGYHAFEVEDDEGCVRILLTKRRSISTKIPLHAIAIGSHLMLEKTV
jgi:hypothetical protein